VPPIRILKKKTIFDASSRSASFRAERMEKIGGGGGEGRLPYISHFPRKLQSAYLVVSGKDRERAEEFLWRQSQGGKHYALCRGREKLKVGEVIAQER